MLLVAIVALAAGVLAGSGLAALAHAPPNDACSDFVSLPEGSSSGGSLNLWPLGLRCEYLIGSEQVRSEYFGPTIGELWAWIVLTALLSAAALIKRTSALARGAVGAACLLALVGVAWQFAGIMGAFLAAAIPGSAFVFALDLLLRPGGRRSWPSSALVAGALVPLTLLRVPRVPFPRRARGCNRRRRSHECAVLRLARERRPPRSDLLPSQSVSPQPGAHR
ncbi:MAG: hypothetical protein WKF42_06650 [Solirubrobacteraceae bacterium]